MTNLLILVLHALSSVVPLHAQSNETWDWFRETPECSSVFRRYSPQPDLASAVVALRPCVEAINARFGVQVAVYADLVPNGTGRPEAIGILFDVTRLQIGDTGFGGMLQTLDAIRGSIYGYPVGLKYAPQQTLTGLDPGGVVDFVERMNRRNPPDEGVKDDARAVIARWAPGAEIVRFGTLTGRGPTLSGVVSIRPKSQPDAEAKSVIIRNGQVSGAQG